MLFLSSVYRIVLEVGHEGNRLVGIGPCYNVYLVGLALR